MRGNLTILIATFVLLGLLPQTDLTFVRHGETVANATGKYNSRTLNEFSEKGQRQVDLLTARLLKSRRFEQILVSPSPRAMKTILPYLMQTHQMAIVWPLLYECCTGRRTTSKPTRFAYGPRIVISPGQKAYFRLLPGENSFPVSPDFGSGLAQVNASVAQFRREFADKRILIVGHSAHGGKFLFALTGKHIQVKNAVEINARF